MRHKLISDGRTNEVRPIGIEPFSYEQIDLPQVDQSEIDGDFLGVRALRFGVDVQLYSWQPGTILPPSRWMVKFVFRVCWTNPGAGQRPLLESVDVVTMRYSPRAVGIVESPKITLPSKNDRVIITNEVDFS